jgi:hypothetical protein
VPHPCAFFLAQEWETTNPLARQRRLAPPQVVKLIVGTYDDEVFWRQKREFGNRFSRISI